ncbi:LPS export ABC transporter periplasmic protein LptC [Aliiroseovarius sp. PrR006]|uniref:LPS export ABC transporter periplasmic protein LptC n=1 Tax=Aliiroseovarius sp. PrR006 TaxID=2706883 RepID=UPI0013D1244E|nr:LPS export ABC transporter periplasmic protein LptC [Aliiroseovarius sp. PrR006]NDW54424.1 LPS export ABC transporter periplasmic protein LptC [Aliiroseovarius sp. PrR006]
MSGTRITYTRLVNWLKIILPATALVLLSLMFLVSKSIDPTTSLTYARINLDELTGEQKITNPKFSSVTEDGAAIQFSAASAAPDAERTNHFKALDLVADIETPDGAQVHIKAAQADIDGEAHQIDLSGGVSLRTSTDYWISTETLTTSMDSTYVASNGPVEATGPMGDLSAGDAVISRAEGEDGGYVLVFKDGVKLVYDPKDKGEPR